MDETTTRRHLAVLAAATSSVELGPVGYAAVVTAEAEAYRALHERPDCLAPLEGDLIDLVANGPPGAIVYAALLLRRLGRDVRPLVARHADDERECTIAGGGCTIETLWLGEATRWAMGERFCHPLRALRAELANLAGANWFELPHPSTLAAVEAGRRVAGLPQRGVWTFAFARLWLSPELARVRGELVALTAHASPAVRLYAELLRGRLDGDPRTRLAPLASSPQILPLPPRWLFSRRTTMGDEVTRLIDEGEFV